MIRKLKSQSNLTVSEYSVSKPTLPENTVMQQRKKSLKN